MLSVCECMHYASNLDFYQETVSAIYCSSACSLSDIIFLIDNVNLIKIKVSLNHRFLSFLFLFSFLFLVRIELLTNKQRNS